jgi:SHS2 domain-containing protein
MERYRILPHTADGKFRAFGATIEEAFANAALAVAALMWDWTKVGKDASFRIEARGRDFEQLLVTYLAEIPYLLETKHFLLGSVEGLSIIGEQDGYTLSATFWGDLDPDRHDIFGDVKAITYSEMKIEHACDHWSVQVVADM